MQTPISSCVAEGWWRCGRQGFYFGVLEAKQGASSTHSFPPNLNWQSCHSQCAHSPVSPEAPPDVFSSHLSFLGMWWRQQLCPNLRWWHHTTTMRSFSPAWGHPTPLLQFYTFSVMDNDVVALLSLLWQLCSRTNCSFSCISFMCWLSSHGSVSYAVRLMQLKLLNRIPFFKPTTCLLVISYWCMQV